LDRVRIRLASDDQAWLEERARQLGPVEDLVVTASVRPAELSLSATPAVVLLDGGADLSPALEIIASQTRLFPATACVLLLRDGWDLTQAFPRAALAGARVVLPGNCELPELAEGLYKAADCVAAATAGQAEAAGPAAADRVITVFGTKGGVGRTTVAVNLAAALAARGLRTALLDLHFDWGNAGIWLRGTPGRPFSELLSESGRLDADLLQGFMARHSSGVYVLPAPPKPEMAEFVHTEHVKAILRAAREGFEAVVIDTPPAFPDTVFPALESADHILLLTTPDVASLRNARGALGVLDLVQIGRAKTHVVLNRASRSSGVRRADVEATLGLPVWAALPSDEAVALRAANQGVSLAEAAGGSRLGRAIAQLGRQLVPEAGDARRARGRRRGQAVPA